MAHHATANRIAPTCGRRHANHALPQPSVAAHTARDGAHPSNPALPTVHVKSQAGYQNRESMPYGRFIGETVPRHLESLLEVPNRAICHVAPCTISRLATRRHVKRRILGSHALPSRGVVTPQVAKPRRRQWRPVPSPQPVHCHQANESPTSGRL